MTLPFKLIANKDFEAFTKEEWLEGQVLLVDKPLEWTSFQVVNKLKYSIRKMHGLKKIKIGHAGTLDPLATGLLIICTGKMTKSIEQFQGQEKEYTGTITLGATTPSFDLETVIDQTFSVSDINSDDVELTAKSLTGSIEQYPPIHSAVKVDGKRAYKSARAGETPQVKLRTVEIKAFDVTRCEIPAVDFRVVCSKGTYIRSLASDFGKALNNGAHLSALRRTRIGEFSLED